MGLYRFHWDCGRQGNLEGVFEATETEVASLTDKEIWFGEVLGKHSDVGGVIENDDIDLLTSDQDFIDKAHEYDLIPSGFNPFHYLDE